MSMFVQCQVFTSITNGGILLEDRDLMAFSVALDSGHATGIAQPNDDDFNSSRIWGSNFGDFRLDWHNS